MKCDLHVHTLHSGMCTVPVARRFCRESYNEPGAVYEALKSKGMDLVTITDHDSIDAAEHLRRFDDFFVSEEVTCTLPSGTEIHVGVYDICDRDHMELQRRRDDFFSFLAYLKEQNLFFSVNHVFSGLTGKRAASDFDLVEKAFPAMEVRNGAMINRVNASAEQLAGVLGKAFTAGSDSHTMHGLGGVFTSVPFARNRHDYLSGLRAGHGVAHGESGTYCKLTLDVLTICGHLLAERPWTLALMPLAALVPAVTLSHYILETLFARRWSNLTGSWSPKTRPSIERVPA